MSNNHAPVEVEATEEGRLILTSAVLGPIEPHDRFHVEHRGEEVLLRRQPREEAAPVPRTSTWQSETPEERVAAFDAHVRRYSTNAGLSDAAVSRASIYD